MNHERARTLILQQFVDGSMSSGTWDDLRQHLRRCRECRALYDRHAELEMGIAGGAWLSPARRERMEARLCPGDRLASIPPRWERWAPALALAAAVVLYVADPRPPGLVARGNPDGRSRRYIEAFYEAPTHEAIELGEHLPKSAPVLFTYTNGVNSPHRYVAIAGLDASGRVHWYYPPFERADQPEVKSVAIARGVADVPMPERLYADHALGRLEICALFSEEPLDVKKIDPTVERSRRWPDGVERSCIRTEVVDD